MESHLTELLEQLPESPGVYLHKDGQGRVLYVGKALNLRSRVRSYFQPSADHTPRIAAMVRQVQDIELFRTSTESEALILEANLIKKHQPRYNVNLKDDKSYPFFKLTVNEMYPRLFLVREKLEKDAEYYGPYASVKKARETLAIVRRHFKLRTSKMKLDGTRTYRPCINFQLRKCLAPCRGVVEVEQYWQQVHKVRLFFQGRGKELMARLDAEMNEHAAAQRYEEAAAARDALAAVRRTFEQQLAVVPDPDADQDVFAVYRESHYAGVEVLFIRHGRLLGSDFLLLERTEGSDDAEVLGGVLRRLYTRPSALLPREVIVACPVEDQEVLEAFLTREKGARVHIVVAQRGAKRRLIEMASENAKLALHEKMARRLDDEAVLEEVQRTLHLRRPPRRVEAFDISNIQGAHTVASMVVFEDNRASKGEYRKFRIRSVAGPDDFLAMAEVLGRRYRRALAEGQPLPELILIDGGKGQVNMAEAVLQELGIAPTRLDLIGLAKGRSERRRGLPRAGNQDFEYVVKPSLKNELRLKKNSATLHFLQRVRDESHRFAITFHRSLRRRETLRSQVEEIPGVGRKRAQLLLRHFGSLRALQQADPEALLAVPGLPAKLAGELHRVLHPAPGAGAGPRLSAGEASPPSALDPAERGTVAALGREH
ncbi:MAG: excinuclease ABC subunit UvrC [Candidatus Lambdaproteobacteria bacterium]|nr:excinuclease ABC subunit UvrC [Candidatus Lambdaproteobacteria bacterium]